MNPTIQTFTGRVFSYTEPFENVYAVHDIAHGLSMTCRYAGQCRFHYSVAQHSVLVSYLVPPENALEALLHDATEAYMCDIPTPLKQLIPEYKFLEQGVDIAIRKYYELPLEMSPAVKYADALALAIERPFVLSHGDMEWELIDVPYELAQKHAVQRMAIEYAEQLWLNRYFELQTF